MSKQLQPSCAGFDGCHELEGVVYDFFVHDPACPKSPEQRAVIEQLQPSQRAVKLAAELDTLIGGSEGYAVAELEWFLDAALRSEREACAKQLEALVTFTEDHNQKDANGCTWCKALEDAAAAIRNHREGE